MRNKGRVGEVASRQGPSGACRDSYGRVWNRGFHLAAAPDPGRHDSIHPPAAINGNTGLFAFTGHTSMNKGRACFSPLPQAAITSDQLDPNPA